MSVPMDAVSAPNSHPAWPPPLYFPVSVTKLVVMSTVTLGLYQLYWFWRNWLLVKNRERTRILPFMRALLAYFFVYALFDRIYEEQPRSRPPVLLAIAWILLTIGWRVPDPWWLIAFANVLPLIPVQRRAIRRNALAAPDHDRNERFTAWNWTLIAVVGLFAIVAVIGAFLPEPPPA